MLYKVDIDKCGFGNEEVKNLEDKGLILKTDLDKEIAEYLVYLSMINKSDGYDRNELEKLASEVLEEFNGRMLHEFINWDKFNIMWEKKLERCNR